MERGCVKQVFVETNFLIGVARPCPQEAAVKLLSRHGKDLALHIPWCSLPEAKRTLRRIIDDDLGFDQSMLKFAVHSLKPAGELKDLGTLTDFAKRVRTARRLAKAGIEAQVDRVAKTMNIIPPSASVVDETLKIWKVKDLPPFDEMILGTVLARAAELYQQGEREIYFCNLNKSDFSPYDKGGMAITRPTLDIEYARCGITYLSSFDVPN